MMKKINMKKKLQGKVVRNKCKKTLVVEVGRKLQHGVYEKFVRAHRRYHVHDECSLARVGDTVTIVESRPRSKLKRWDLVSIG
jgi:small subunit ribosomal protein S17